MDRIDQIIRFIRDLYKNSGDYIPLHAPAFKGMEKEYLLNCLESTFVSSVGKYVNEFENEIAKYCGAKQAIACVNGTSALHLALKLIDVEANTEVITQPLTFVATANTISYCGGKPIFIDVDIDTMGLSPVKLNKWIQKEVKLVANSNTKQLEPINKKTGRKISACVPMHTFGHPCRIDEIIQICDQYSIPVIEDATESLGSFYKGVHTGINGKIGVLSFNGNKIITTAGGGMLLFNNDENLAKKAKHLSTQAKVPHLWEFYHDEIGFNYRLPNLNAALGLAQLAQLERILDSKRKIAQEYSRFFKEIGIKYMEEPELSRANYWLNCILLKDKNEKEQFLKHTNQNNIMTRPAWKLMVDLPMYKTCERDDLENAYYLADRLVNLPSSYIL